MLMRPALFKKMAEPFEVALLVAGSATAVPELRALEQQLGYKLQSVFAYAFSVPRLHDGRSAKFQQNVARFRLYRHRSLQFNTPFAAVLLLLRSVAGVPLSFLFFVFVGPSFP